MLNNKREFTIFTFSGKVTELAEGASLLRTCGL